MMALLEINSQSRVVGNGTAGTAMAVPLFATKKEVAPAELNKSLSKLLREKILTQWNRQRTGSPLTRVQIYLQRDFTPRSPDATFDL